MLRPTPARPQLGLPRRRFRGLAVDVALKWAEIVLAATVLIVLMATSRGC